MSRERDDIDQRLALLEDRLGAIIVRARPQQREESEKAEVERRLRVLEERLRLRRRE